MTVYFISGLGADKRAFQKIKLSAAYEIKHIDWITPISEESLKDYSARLARQVDTSKPFILAGLSFGGMVVTEISKILKPTRSILISSISTRSQLPWYYRLIEKLRLHKIIPAQLLKWPNPLTFWAFGARTKEEKKLLRQILHDTDGKFLKWAIHAILTWTNEQRPETLFHIHGTNDKMLPVRYTRPHVKVERGGHFMVYSMADNINKILEEKLSIYL